MFFETSFAPLTKRKQQMQQIVFVIFALDRRTLMVMAPKHPTSWPRNEIRISRPKCEKGVVLVANDLPFMIRITSGFDPIHQVFGNQSIIWKGYGGYPNWLFLSGTVHLYPIASHYFTNIHPCFFGRMNLCRFFCYVSCIKYIRGFQTMGQFARFFEVFGWNLLEFCIHFPSPFQTVCCDP